MPPPSPEEPLGGLIAGNTVPQLSVQTLQRGPQIWRTQEVALASAGVGAVPPLQSEASGAACALSSSPTGCASVA